LSAGILQLEVIPGRISAVRFADPDPDTSLRSAFPARPGDLLNLRDIEQALEQLKRVPSGTQPSTLRRAHTGEQRHHHPEADQAVVRRLHCR
jgi:hemolysin activation/secretion protein